MVRGDDPLSGNYDADLEALLDDTTAAGVIAEPLRGRFLELQEDEMRYLLDKEYEQPQEVRRSRPQLKAEVWHRAFARLCVEYRAHLNVPLLSEATVIGERTRVELQLERMIERVHGERQEEREWPKKRLLRRSHDQFAWADDPYHLGPHFRYANLYLGHLPAGLLWLNPLRV